MKNVPLLYTHTQTHEAVKSTENNCKWCQSIDSPVGLRYQKGKEKTKSCFLGKQTTNGNIHTKIIKILFCRKLKVLFDFQRITSLVLPSINQPTFGKGGGGEWVWRLSTLHTKNKWFGQLYTRGEGVSEI